MSRKNTQEPPTLTLVVTAADIDALYQRPLAEFTAARNELAKRAGKNDPSIKALEKPSVPAWAVNQLYWRERKLYDALIEASEAVRAAHRNVIAGKGGDLRDAERAHRDAERAAADRIKTLLADAGEAATAATLTAVSETLAALPADVTPGRLTRPLKPSGFEVLTGVAPRPPAPAAPRGARPTLVKPATDPAVAAKEAAAARRAAEAAAREAAREKERREVEVKKAKAALEKAQAAVARAEAEVADCERALSEARRTRDRLQVEAHLALNEYQHATRRARE
jgi:hypothetical protein